MVFVNGDHHEFQHHQQRKDDYNDDDNDDHHHINITKEIKNNVFITNTV